MNIFVILDRQGRQIRLTAERWKHIATRHPELSNKIEEIKQTITTPSFQVQDRADKQLYYHHSFMKTENMYLVIAVKYLNGEGFVITVLTSKHRKR